MTKGKNAKRDPVAKRNRFINRSVKVREEAVRLLGDFQAREEQYQQVLNELNLKLIELKQQTRRDKLIYAVVSSVLGSAATIIAVIYLV